MSKEKQTQIVGVSSRIIAVSSSLQIPISSSNLPTKKMANLCNIDTPQQADKDQIYDIDARNPFFKFHFTTYENQTSTTMKKQIQFSKMDLMNMFLKMEQIQQKLDAYS